MTIYTQALNAVNGNRTSATLFASKTKTIFLKRTNGGVNLVYQKRDARNLVRKTTQIKCGFYNPRRGWTFSLNRESYARWVAKTGHKIKPENKQ